MSGMRQRPMLFVEPSSPLHACFSALLSPRQHPMCSRLVFFLLFCTAHALHPRRTYIHASGFFFHS